MNWKRPFGGIGMGKIGLLHQCIPSIGTNDPISTESFGELKALDSTFGP